MSIRQDVDRIVVNSKEMAEIFAWRDQNKGAVRAYKDVFMEAVIENPNNSKAQFYFRVVDSFEVEYKFYFDNVMVLKALVGRMPNNKFVILQIGNTEDYGIDPVKRDKCLDHFSKFMPGDNSFEGILMDNATIHASVMAYLTYRYNEIEVVEEDFMSPARLKKAIRHNKYSPNDKIKIKRRVIKLKDPQFKNVTKRDIKRVAESWGVRGHWRHLKSGKTAWVKPYTKGAGKKKSKEYSMS